MRHHTVCRVLAWAALASSVLLGGQVTASAETASPGRTRVVPNPQYRAGALHRRLLGTRYRELWATGFEVDVLDLARFSGGLTPTKRGGGKQTKSLRFEGRDGREWKFRSIDKDTSAVLPPELRDTFVDAIAQDQMSAAHPLGPLVVDELAHAAGILSVPHHIVLLPDDPALGEFRADFGGVLGFLEEKVQVHAPRTAGFEGYTKLLDTVELWKRLEASPKESVDAQAFVKARLFDVLINDFDRHKDQWQWALREGGTVWEPIPEDRDQAFVRFDGLVMRAVRPSQPRLVKFDAKYPSIGGLTWQGRFVDRRHLASLEWPAWQKAVAELQAAITDAVIEGAVRRLPPEYQALDGARLAAKLKSRRASLPEAARRFYSILADDAEVHATDADDVVSVSATGDDRVLVKVDDGAGHEEFARRFSPRETRSVRIYLKGGNDRVVRGPGTGAVLLRVVGGDGNDVLDDSRAGHTRFYDESGENRVVPGPGTHRDDRPYEQPADSAGNPARDWGHTHILTPWLSAGGDLGVFVGESVEFVRYGFRKHPYAQRHVLGVGYATGLQAFRASYDGAFVRSNSPAEWRLSARASQVDLLRFYGLGNETLADRPEDAFKIEEKRLFLWPSYRFGLRGADLSLGPVVQYTDTPLAAALRGSAAPYGFGGFGEVGARAALVIDRRDRARAASHGGILRLAGTYYPRVWSVTGQFGEVHGEVAAFGGLHGYLAPTIGVRAGGKHVFGPHPFHEAAFLGGPATVRGLPPERYAGDSMVFANSELRVRLAQARLLLPSDVGVFGLADMGRVYQRGESSTRWHSSYGGGLWVAVLKPENTLSFAVARAEGATRLYVQGGFGF